MILETSRDLLNIVLAVAVFWVTFFLCSVLFYLAALLRRANKVTKEFHERLEHLEAAIHGIRDKLENSASYLALIAEGGKQLLEYVMEKRARKKKPKE